MLALAIAVETTISKIVTTVPKHKCNTLMRPQETMILDLEIMSPPQEITIIMMLTNHTNVVIVQNNQTCQCYPNLFHRNLKMNTTKAMATGVTKEWGQSHLTIQEVLLSQAVTDQIETTRNLRAIFHPPLHRPRTKTIIGFQSQVTFDHLTRGLGVTRGVLEEIEEGVEEHEPLLLHPRRIGEVHLIAEVLQQTEGVLHIEVALPKEADLQVEAELQVVDLQVEADLQIEAPILVEVPLQVEVALQIEADQKAEEHWNQNHWWTGLDLKWA